MLHANRFGEFEERCAGGVYLASIWIEWLDTYTDVRNQLACYLRNVKGIMDQCIFQLSNDLLSYDDSMCQINSCGIPSLSPYFLNPFKRESSPYGVEVCNKLAQYLQSTDHVIMNLYIKKICKTIAAILKRQRGNQYGFGDKKDSEEHAMKNMTNAMLDDPDATNSKPIENLFGNLDREIRKTGPQGFKKVSDDLLIKYARDAIAENYEWRKNANRNEQRF